MSFLQLRGLAMRLKEIRKAKQVSQQNVARMGGIQQAAVCRWERGQYDPKISVVVKVAKGLGVSVDELLGECRPASARNDTGAPS